MPEAHPSALRRSSGAAEATWQPEVSLRGQNVALARAAEVLKGRPGKVLEAGAGTARFLRALRRRVPSLEGYACDLSAQGLALARRQDPTLHVLRGDLTALPYRDGVFHTVLVFDVLEHLFDPQQGVRELWRVLAPEGLLHALVPCEGQPLTLHWLMWKAHIAADLKEKRVGHVQRFTHQSLRVLLERNGFALTHCSYSMHPVGQVKDILLHLEQGPAFPRWLRRNPLYRTVSVTLWGAAYVESTLLRRVPWSSVALHVTAVKRAPGVVTRDELPAAGLREAHLQDRESVSSSQVHPERGR